MKAPSPLIRPDTCRMCKHYTQLPMEAPGHDEGECHGAPPQVVAIVTPTPSGPALNVQTVFPRVQPDWQCGMFKPRIQLALQ